MVWLLALGFAAARTLASQEPPKEWIDPDTGHRIIRLSREPGSASLYFNQNAYTPQGDKMIFTTPGGIASVDLRTRALDLAVPEDPALKGSIRVVGVGRRTRLVYYVRRAGTNLVAYATDVDTHATRSVGVVPPGGSVAAVNADETLLAGTVIEPRFPPGRETDEAGSRANVTLAGPEALERERGESKGSWMMRRFESRVPMALFTLNTKTGEVRTFDHSTDWLNHVQMSPTDPSLMLFCHEGPWHLVDRIWTIRTGGSGLRLVHPRTMQMEIAGHEFFGAGGQWIWYDLQTPRGEDFWLAGYAAGTGERRWYHLQRDEWSVHYNVSPDGSLFAGDGGGEGMVAHGKNGKWIYLFRPEPVPVPRGPRPQSDHFIQPGILRAERLVNMSQHDYRLEPNVRFTPDGKWVVFRSNMFGPTHVFEVEVARARP
jgi:oligogalacturonide lyase